jgi:hypothetical protein
MRVTDGIPLGWFIVLPVDTVNSIQTRKACMADPDCTSFEWVLVEMKCFLHATCNKKTAHTSPTWWVESKRELWIKDLVVPMETPPPTPHNECGRLEDGLRNERLADLSAGGLSQDNISLFLDLAKSTAAVPAGTVCSARCVVDTSINSHIPPTTSTFTCSNGTWVGELICPADERHGDPAWEGNNVTLKDGHFYRAMSELYPMAGGVQRAANSSYCGFRGHMATPESLDEAKLIAKVVQGSTRNNGSSVTVDWEYNTGVAGPAVGEYGRVWIPITAKGAHRVAAGNLFSTLLTALLMNLMNFGFKTNVAVAFVLILCPVGWALSFVCTLQSHVSRKGVGDASGSY